jgi:hypothetical protein
MPKDGWATLFGFGKSICSKKPIKPQRRRDAEKNMKRLGFEEEKNTKSSAPPRLRGAVRMR